MDVQLDPSTADYTGQRIDNLANAVYLRLFTPLGSYWAVPDMGSRLHELQREKDVPRVRMLARQYAEQALAPLIKDERATAISVTASQSSPGRCGLRIQVTDRGGVLHVFNHHVKVA
ncbi:phage GP46 family protein [Achromobacter insolitus]|uniref:phage GP46 family protein n=1 Tax=Achromobacter insolitus TaxID=217204 RepID=UPI0028ACDB03|nr:phage GP46 family protein [Achromobacter insolitus]